MTLSQSQKDSRRDQSGSPGNKPCGEGKRATSPARVWLPSCPCESGNWKPLETKKGMRTWKVNAIGTYDSWTTLAEEREKEQNEGGKTV